MCRRLAGLSLFVLLAQSAGAQQNVLLIIADDLGVDRVAAYGEHPDPGHTPTIDALAQQGVLFRNAWANPVCSSSRMTMLTGRFGYRTGVGRGIAKFNDFPVSIDSVSIADVMSPTHRTAAIGKWHMHSSTLPSPLTHPNDLGFEHYLGGMNVFPGVYSDGYVNYQKVEDGVGEFTSTTYATTEQVDDALAVIEDFGSDPWFVWLAFHAPHAPFHVPPPELHTFDLPTPVQGNVPIHVKAAIEAMDTEMARLFASMDPAVLANTTIIFVGDNGTDQPASTPPFTPAHAKTTIYEGGLNVPLIVKGPGVVQGAECDGLVCITDLFATIADLAGAPHPTAVDSVSLAPYFSDPAQPSLRKFAYGEMFSLNGWGPYERMDRAVRGQRYKLLRFHDPYSVNYTEEMYNLLADPFETNNLLLGTLTPVEQLAYDELSVELDDQYAPWIDMGFGLAGVNGVPSLQGDGTLAPGDPVSLTLSGAAGSAFGVLLVGADHFDFPFKGGVLVPDFTTGGLFHLSTDPTGSLTLATTWPAGIPAFTLIYWQIWIADAAAAKGFSASNGLRSRSY